MVNLDEMTDYVAECEAFLVKMEACTTQRELDQLCKVECVIYFKSRVLQRELYRKRGELIGLTGMK
jgi:hypothetical protein